MKWTVHLNGDGCYWWIAETPVGPYYVCSNPMKWRDVAVEWYPMDTRSGEPEVIASNLETEDAGKAAAEAHLKALARKLRRWLK